MGRRAKIGRLEPIKKEVGEVRLKRGKRKLISFEEDIAKEVAGYFDNRVSPEQVLDVWKAYVSFVRGVLAQTDCMRVIIPYLGVLENNRHKIAERLRMLEYIKKQHGRLRPHQVNEREHLLAKAELIDRESKGRNPKDPLVSRNRFDVKESLRGLRGHWGWDRIEDFQAREFNNL